MKKQDFILISTVVDGNGKNLTRAKGQKGENLAIAYLLQRQFTIIQKNFRTKDGEIDVIAVKENSLSFIEVKLRTNNIMGTALESISLKKQQRIIKTSKAFLTTHPEFETMNLQYSVIAIQKNGLDYTFDFIENAFCLNVDFENETSFP